MTQSALVKNRASPLPYELLIGWRYMRAGRSAGRNGFISFISGVSMLGIALGVAALIIVLSVMNGFQKEVRDRMLAVVSHIELTSSSGEGFTDVEAILQKVRAHPEVVAAAPFVAQQALLARGEDMRGALVRGIDPERETQVSDFTLQLPPHVRDSLQTGSFHVVLGGELALAMGVQVGDRITLIAPGGQVTPAGVLPRLKQLTVSGIFDSGHYEYDATLALMHMDDAQRIFRVAAPSGIRLKIQHINDARAVASDLVSLLGSDVLVRDWTRQNRTWFAAVQVEKRMMFIILTLIVAVAAFNLVTTLVMTVTDKRADIAILRTLGASPWSILAIFVVQGATVGVMGTLGGLLLGLGVAFNIDVIVPAIEHLLGASFLPRDIYLISRMPSDPQAADIWPVALISLALAFVATIYPSWRASRIQPAQALRYE
jgi:lipoprotein-releasing system permease protein